TTFITKGHARAYSRFVFSEENRPKVSWVRSGQAGPDGLFQKRLGVELSGRDSLQATRRIMSPMGTNMQATSTRTLTLIFLYILDI
nr:hypothetical protein [Tanacetum cinerariifolium]